MKSFITLCLIATFSFGFALENKVEFNQEYSIDKKKIEVPTNG